MQIGVSYKVLVLSGLCAGLIACGNGSGNKGNIEDLGGNIDTNGAKRNIEPLTESSCNDVPEYIWQDDQCQLEGNPNVKNLAAIESLGQDHRDGIIAWLSSVEKDINLDRILGEASDSSNEDTSSNVYFDTYMLAKKLDSKSVIEADDQVLFVKDFTTPSGFSERTKSSSVGINNEQPLTLSFRIERSGAELVFWVRDQEVYRTKLINSLTVSTHLNNADFPKDAITTDFNEPYQYSTTQQFSNLDGSLFANAAAEAVKPNSTTRKYVSNFLDLSERGSANIFFTFSTPFNYQVNVDSEKSPYFSSRFLNVYLKETPFTRLLKSDTAVDLQIEANYKAKDIPQLDLSAPDKFYSATHDLSFTPMFKEEDQTDGTVTTFIDIDSYEILSSKLNQYPLDTQEQREVIQNNIINEYAVRQTALTNTILPDSLTAEQQLAHPDLAETITVLTGWLGSADTLLLLLEEANMAALLAKGIPSYLPNTPNVQQVKDMLNWPGALKNAMQASVRNIPATEVSILNYQNRLALWQTQSGNAAFYTNINDELNYLFADLNEEQLSYYTPSFIDLVTSYAYRNTISGLQNGSMVSDVIKAAIASSGQDFSDPIPNLIERVAKLTYVANQGSWGVSSSTLGKIRNIPELLTDNNKDQIKIHDQIADQFGIALMKATYPEYKVDEFEEILSDKIDSLQAISTFIPEDANRKKSDFDFNLNTPLLAQYAYQNNWSLETLKDLYIVLQFNLPSGITGLNCTEGSTVERFKCLKQNGLANFNKLSTVQGEGYLYSENGVNPYVANSQTLIGMYSKISEIEKIQKLTFDDLGTTYSSRIKTGLWLDCNGQQIKQQAELATQVLDEYLAMVQNNPSPAVFSEEYTQQEDKRDEFKTHLDICGTR